MLEQDDGDIVEEEVNIRGTTIEFHAPTVPQGENVQNHAVKKKYSHSFDRPVFTGKATLPRKQVSARRESICTDRNKQYFMIRMYLVKRQFQIWIGVRLMD